MDNKLMHYDEWRDLYKPIEDPDEGEVRYLDDPLVKSADPNRIWTLIDGDDGNTYIVNGMHLVNRIGLIVTEEPFLGEFLEILDD